MKKIFDEFTCLQDAIDFLAQAGCNEITKIDGETFHFNINIGVVG